MCHEHAYSYFSYYSVALKIWPFRPNFQKKSRGRTPGPPSHTFAAPMLNCFRRPCMCSQECSGALKNLVGLIINKHPDLHYSSVMARLRCCISFLLFKWFVTCFRGCRASYLRHSFAGVLVKILFFLVNNNDLLLA